MKKKYLVVLIVLMIMMLTGCSQTDLPKRVENRIENKAISNLNSEKAAKEVESSTGINDAVIFGQNVILKDLAGPMIFKKGKDEEYILRIPFWTQGMWGGYYTETECEAIYTVGVDADKNVEILSIEYDIVGPLSYSKFWRSFWWPTVTMFRYLVYILVFSIIVGIFTGGDQTITPRITVTVFSIISALLCAYSFYTGYGTISAGLIAGAAAIVGAILWLILVYIITD